MIGVRFRAAVAAAGLLAAGCGASGSPVIAAPTATSTTVPVTVVPSSAVLTTTTTVAPEAAAPPPVVVLPPPVRHVVEQDHEPYAVVEDVLLRHPARRVERVGFHESGHDGARQQEAVTSAVLPTVLETRERGTGAQTAADIVVDPAGEVRAPVTGTVLRASPYTLYCDFTDEYAVIEPDDRPGWEVKVLHVVGLQVAAGDRVVAGETVLALSAHVLPFESQVDDLRTSEPAWPHVHIEVVDPSIPDRPSPGGGCP